MADLTLTHSLSLALRLLDATTGMPVSLSDVSLTGCPERPREVETGTLLFIDLPREDFSISLSSRRFEDRPVDVHYAELDEKLPILDVPLVPRTGLYGGEPLLTLEGVCPGITELSAARPGDTSCLFREFDAKKHLLTVFNPHALSLDRPRYALIDTENGACELFQIAKRVNDTTLKLPCTLAGSYGNYSPLTPVVDGLVRPDGSYTIRVRDDGSDASWLLRYVVNGEEHFKSADFRSEDPVVL